MNNNGENYLNVLYERAFLDDTLSDEELCNIRNQLWKLLGQRADKYTMGDSSSVPIEVAEELSKSICYCISISLKSKDYNVILSQIKAEDINNLFLLGLAEIEKQIISGKELLGKIKSSTLLINNVFYQDMMLQVQSFFKKYDYNFFAHENSYIPDYPLCHPIGNEQGIEYINKYLSYIIIENDFCGHFNVDTITDLLQSYCSDYKMQLINIYELVAINAIGLILVKGNVFTLDICKADSNKIINYLLSLTTDNAIIKLAHAAKELCKLLDIKDFESQSYLKKTATELYDRIEVIKRTNCFHNLFISMDIQKEEKVATIKYIDSDMMNNEDLRNVMSELSSCRFVLDKISIVKQQIHSLRDLTEVLNICFWDDEFIALFDSLDNIAIAVLLYFSYQRCNEDSLWQSESGWEVQLLNYMKEIEYSRKIEIENIVNEMNLQLDNTDHVN